MHNDSTATNISIVESTKQIAALGDDVHAAHIAEHIRGMVAATMAHLPSHSTDTARHHAQHWQQWALGVADGMGAQFAPQTSAV